MEKEEIFKKIDEGANLPPSENDEAKVEVQLNSDPVPTNKEKENANIEVENSDAAEAESISETVEPKLTPEQESVEKMLTQSQVDEIVGRTRTETREKTKSDFYSRYGVKDETELDEMIGKAQKSDLWKEDYDRLTNDLQEARNKIAMYESGINPERYEDARLILTGKGMEITTENLLKEMETHPEWRKQIPEEMEQPKDEVEEVFQKVEVKEPEKPVSKITVLGNENPKEEKEVDERKLVKDWYNF